MGDFHHVNVFSDLGQHYIQGTELGEVYDMSVLHTASGTHIVTSSKGCICTYLQKDDTTTGNKAVKTDILSSICCAIKSSVPNENGIEEEKMVVLGAVGKTVYTMQQEDETIGSPCEALVKPPQDAASLQKYFPMRTENGYKVLSLYKNKDDKTWSLGYFEWKDGKISSSMDTGLTTTSPEVSWVKRENEDCVMYKLDGEWYIDSPNPSYDASQQIKSSRLGKEQGQSRILGTYEDLYFLIDEDGLISAFHLADLEEAEGEPLWTVMTGDGSISDVHAAWAYDAMQLFLFSKESQRLYHCPITKDICNVENVCIPLDEGVLHYSVDAGAGYVHLSVARGDAACPQLVHYRLSADGNEWVDSRMYLESKSDVRDVKGHITELNFCEKDNSPIPNQKMKIWTSEDASLFIDGRVLRTGPKTPYIVQSNSMGSLEIVQEGDSIDGITIIMQRVDDMDKPVGSYYMITPGEKYKAKIKGMSKDDLGGAVTSTGERLVDDDFEGQRDQVLDGASQAMHNMLGGTAVSENENLKRIKEADWYSDEDNSLKVTAYREDPTPYLGKLPPKSKMKSCILSFSDNKLTYRQVTPQEALAHMQNTYQAIYGSDCCLLSPEASCMGASNGFFSSIASLFKAIGKGIVKVAEVVVHSVETAVTATIHFIDKTVHQAVNFVVTAVKDAVHLVESVLKQIEVGIEKVIQWIGFMLDWKDIQNAAKYVEKEFEDGFDWMEKMLDEVADYSDKHIDMAKEKIEAYFKRFKEELPDDDLKEQSNKPPADNPISQADAHNVVKKHLGDGGMGFQEISFTLTSEEEQALDDFAGIADRIASTLTLDPMAMVEELKSGKCSAKSIGDSLMNMLGYLLSNALELAKEVLHTLISAVKVLLRVMRGILTTKIQIPLVSSLIKMVTGMDLTILNLASFAIAIPFTVAYKLIYHKAPVQADANQLVASNDSKTILAMCLIGMINFAQVVISAMMCLKAKWLIWIPALVELVCILTYFKDACETLSPKINRLIFGTLGVIGCLTCLIDVFYAKRMAFRNDKSYYFTKLIAALAGSVISAIVFISDMEKNLWVFAVPGGLLFSVQTTLNCSFYWNRRGDNWIIVVIAGVLGIVITAMSYALIQTDDEKPVLGEKSYAAVY